MRVNRFFLADFALSSLSFLAIVFLANDMSVYARSMPDLSLGLINSLLIALVLSVLKDRQVGGRPSITLVVLGAFAAFGISFVLFLAFSVIAGDFKPLEYFPGYLMIFGIAYCASRFWSLGAFYAARTSVTPVIIYGAGSAGTTLASALLPKKHFSIAAFVDDDPSKYGARILGKKISPSSKLNKLIRRYGVKEVLLAMPSLSAAARLSIIERLSELPVVVKTIPGLDDILSGQHAVSEIQPINVLDLLGRESVAPIPNLLEQCVKDKVVLVTGAGGSIGSEIARQAFKIGCRQIILLEVSEAALYTIERDLSSGSQNSKAEIIPLLGSVLDDYFLKSVFARFDIDTVYHAAAYKHVPLVEQNVCAGVYNNVVGTWQAINAAANAGVDNFVLISTDKAVRPTNFMGASKRVAELIVQAKSSCDSKMRCSMVRFGNVLGSSGSVVPLFQAQIDAGGPLTVTHKEVTRYFMTIPEASQLVIQAGALASGGEIFVLDMGEPVKIINLAEKMIAMSGKRVSYVPTDKQDEIEIKVTGLRPGEKLYEELLISGNVSGTEHPKICVAVESHLSQDEVDTMVQELVSCARANDSQGIAEILSRVVDGFARDRG